jgi:hypothetical protein
MFYYGTYTNHALREFPLNLFDRITFWPTCVQEVFESLLVTFDKLCHYLLFLPLFVYALA